MRATNDLRRSKRWNVTSVFLLRQNGRENVGSHGLVIESEWNDEKGIGQVRTGVGWKEMDEVGTKLPNARWTWRQTTGHFIKVKVFRLSMSYILRHQPQYTMQCNSRNFTGTQSAIHSPWPTLCPWLFCWKTQSDTLENCNWLNGFFHWGN